jgi:hypothetical protein
MTHSGHRQPLIKLPHLMEHHIAVCDHRPEVFTSVRWQAQAISPADRYWRSERGPMVPPVTTIFRQSVSLLHVGRVPIILEALHTVHVGHVPIVLEVLHRLDIQPRGRALYHIELVAVSEDYSARPDFLGP